MRRLARWAFGGEPSSSSSDSEISDDESAAPAREAWTGAYFSSSWRAATPPPPTSTTSAARAQTRATQDTVRAYLDEVAAAPPEVDVGAAGGLDWLLATQEAENVANVEAEAALDHMISRAKLVYRTAPAEVSPVQQELSMEAHFRAQLDALASQYHVSSPVPGEVPGRRDGVSGRGTAREELTPPTFQQLHAAPHEWLWRRGRDGGGVDQDASPPPPPHMDPAELPAGERKPSGSSLLWLVKTLFSRSTPVAPMSAPAGSDDPLGRVRASTPPPFELTLGPQLVASHRASPSMHSPPLSIAQALFTEAALASPVAPPPSATATHNTTTTATITTSTSQKAASFLATPPRPSLQEMTNSAESLTAPARSPGKCTVLAELERLAELELPDALVPSPTPQSHTPSVGESDIRTRFNSFFASPAADTTTALGDDHAPDDDARTRIASVTITTEGLNAEQLIEQRSERYLAAAGAWQPTA